jgi:NAD-reducing hydrogenase large subunit
MGMDADEQKRNIFGMMEADPAMARDGIRLRQFGQQIIEWLSGKRIHPAWVVAGGVSEPLTAANRDRILAATPEALGIAQRALHWFKGQLGSFREEIRTFANFPTLFMGQVDPAGALDHYDGRLRVVDAAGDIVADRLEAVDYRDYIDEAVVPWSFLKSPYYKPAGYLKGIYRVGPLARLNVADRCGTYQADQEWAEFRQLERGAELSSFYYHYARLIEILYAIERVEQLLNEPDILSKHVRAIAQPNNSEGIGMSEAPRGMLLHHYKVDENGLMTWANMIIATGHNNLAMNRGVLQVAKHFVDGNRLKEGMLNRVEAVIRAYDPCLSCSTHAAGRMPLEISLMAPDGVVLDRVKRG